MSAVNLYVFRRSVVLERLLINRNVLNQCRRHDIFVEKKRNEPSKPRSGGIFVKEINDDKAISW